MATDNSHLESKLTLRRHFLAAYHPNGQRHVLDCCQATGRIWRTLSQEFALDSYWGLDLVPKKGRIKVDSARVLAQDGWMADIVDVDTYGSPWAHWLNLLRTAPGPVTVFLTIGSGIKGLGGLRCRISTLEKRALGISFKCPDLLATYLRPLIAPAMLGQSLDRFTVVECLEAFPSESARYIGVRLEVKAG